MRMGEIRILSLQRPTHVMSNTVRTTSNEEKGNTEKAEFTHHDNASSGHEGSTIKEKQPIMSAKEKHLQYVNAKLANPLSGKSKAEIVADVNEWTRENGMEDLVDTFRKGALVAANPGGKSRPPWRK
jgi:hypothetical protein